MQKLCGLPLEGGGFGGLRRSRKEFKSDKTLFFCRLCRPVSLCSTTPSVGYAASVSLRLGHVAALTVHRTVIHYRADTSLPQRRSPRSKQVSANSLQNPSVGFADSSPIMGAKGFLPRTINMRWAKLSSCYHFAILFFFVLNKCSDFINRRHEE